MLISSGFLKKYCFFVVIKQYTFSLERSTAFYNLERKDVITRKHKPSYPACRILFNASYTEKIVIPKFLIQV